MTGGGELDPVLEEFIRVGLWQPDSAGPAGSPRRRELLEFLIARGAPVDRVIRAAADGDLQGLGFDMLVERGSLDANEVALALGLDLDELLVLYRHLGVEISDVRERRFSTDEVEFLTTLRSVLAGFPPDAQSEVLQAIAASVSSLAAAAIGAFVGAVESQLAEEADELAWSIAITEVGEGALDVADGLRDVFRHHMRIAINQQRESMRNVDTRQLSEMAVGFVDLVGYTAATATMPAADLIAFLSDFRHRAHDVVIEGGGRVVKHIGDEVMFSSVDLAQACRIGRGLIDAFAASDAGPRGGLAHGQLIARHGDLYGPVVNLASRLADTAVPGELLAPASIAGADLDGVVLVPAGRRQLKGFDEPVQVVSIE